MGRLKLFFFWANPPGASCYVSGGSGVIAAYTAEQALAMLLEAGEDVYIEYYVKGAITYKMPVELQMPSQPGVLFYDGVTE